MDKNINITSNPGHQVSPGIPVLPPALQPNPSPPVLVPYAEANVPDQVVPTYVVQPSERSHPVHVVPPDPRVTFFS